MIIDKKKVKSRNDENIYGTDFKRYTLIPLIIETPVLPPTLDLIEENNETRWSNNNG